MLHRTSVRIRILFSLTLVVLMGACEFRDDLIAAWRGTPVRMLSYTGILTSTESRSMPTEPFVNANVQENGDLRLVVRAWFHDGGAMAHPYVTQAADGAAILHIWLKPVVKIFGTKCEYLRQFEVAIDSTDWRKMTSLTIYNDDTGVRLSDKLPLANDRALEALLADSGRRKGLENLQGFGTGC